jgi:uncharacterized protein (TIGR00304 family)
MNQPQVIGLGIIIILLGAIIIFSSMFFSKGASKTETKETKFAVGGLIGPIPFGFGNDKKMVLISIVVTAIFALIFILAFFKR